MVAGVIFKVMRRVPHQSFGSVRGERGVPKAPGAQP